MREKGKSARAVGDKNVRAISKSVGEKKKNVGDFPKNVGENLENLRRFFELSPSEDFEEGMFSKKDEYYLEGKPYFCSSRGCANGDFGSVLTRKS